jgi:hypothetical protein
LATTHSELALVREYAPGLKQTPHNTGGVGVGVGVGDAVGVGEAVGLGVPVTVGIGVGDAVEPTAPVGSPMAVGVGVGIGVEVGEEVGEAPAAIDGATAPPITIAPEINKVNRRLTSAKPVRGLGWNISSSLTLIGKSSEGKLS